MCIRDSNWTNSTGPFRLKGTVENAVAILYDTTASFNNPKEVKLGDTENNYTFSFLIDPPANKVTYYFVRAVSASGVSSSYKITEARRDTTPPTTGTMTATYDNTFYPRYTLRITGSRDTLSGISGVQLTVSGKPNIWSMSEDSAGYYLYFEADEVAGKTITYWARDGASNRGNEKTLYIPKDSTGPSISGQKQNPSGWAQSKTISATVTDTRDVYKRQVFVLLIFVTTLLDFVSPFFLQFV